MAVNLTYTLTLAPSDVSPGLVCGKIVFDATAIVATDVIEVKLGFKPKYLKILNVTDRIGAEFFVGMADNSCVKTDAAGVATLEVVGITPLNRGFRVSQNATLALIAASKTLHFVAMQ